MHVTISPFDYVLYVIEDPFGWNYRPTVEVLNYYEPLISYEEKKHRILIEKRLHDLCLALDKDIQEAAIAYLLVWSIVESTLKSHSKESHGGFSSYNNSEWDLHVEGSTCFLLSFSFKYYKNYEQVVPDLMDHLANDPEYRRRWIKDDAVSSAQRKAHFQKGYDYGQIYAQLYQISDYAQALGQPQIAYDLLNDLHQLFPFYVFKEKLAYLALRKCMFPPSQLDWAFLLPFEAGFYRFKQRSNSEDDFKDSIHKAKSFVEAIQYRDPFRDFRPKILSISRTLLFARYLKKKIYRPAQHHFNSAYMALRHLSKRVRKPTEKAQINILQAVLAAFKGRYPMEDPNVARHLLTAAELAPTQYLKELAHHNLQHLLEPQSLPILNPLLSPSETIDNICLDPNLAMDSLPGPEQQVLGISHTEGAVSIRYVESKHSRIWCLIKDSKRHFFQMVHTDQLESKKGIRVGMSERDLQANYGQDYFKYYVENGDFLYIYTQGAMLFRLNSSGKIIAWALYTLSP